MIRSIVILLLYLPAWLVQAKEDLSENPVVSEYRYLQKEILASRDWGLKRLRLETLRQEALILESDKTPVDIAWRRTHALLADLKRMKNVPDLSGETSELETLKAEVEAVRRQKDLSENVPLELFGKITAIRRRIAFKNPLLDFNSIIFLKHNKQARGERHMIDQYLGFNAEKKGGVYMLENAFSGNPTLKSLLEKSPVENGRLKGRRLQDNGSFISLDLDYDGKTILFGFTEAEGGIPVNPDYSTQMYGEDEILKRMPGYRSYYFSPERTYHIFKARADGSGLLQLTDGMWNEFDPVFLPNGRIVFISERAGGACRCGARPLPSATLFAMMPDGSDIIQLSWHDTNEWHPSVDNNGMIVYTRWDYVDRDSDIAHHIWHCFPDGRDPRSMHGNYPDVREMRPWMEMSARAVPGSEKYIAVTARHHGQAYGSLVMIDLKEKDNRTTSQLKRITPETPFGESESVPGIADEVGGKRRTNKQVPAVPSERYGTPWPLSEDYYLCVYDSDCSRYGIYLADSFGNRELLYRDSEIACLDPIPLKPRVRPPAIPSKTLQARADRTGDGQAALSAGKVAIMNVYESELAWPRGTKIKELRVVNIFPKNNSILDDPHIGMAAQSLCRGVMGTVPVEDDGSVYFEVPAGAGIYFQALDENGLMIQNMRSDTYVHPGETLSCIGCHEAKHKIMDSRQAKTPVALMRKPSKLKPEAEGSYPLTFPRLVQPVLNKHCVSCHDRSKKAPSLHGDEFGANGWSMAFITLSKYAWGRSGGNGVISREGQYSIPGKDGARVSRLYSLLKKGHGDVKLTAEEMRRITLWIDCNSNFYGAYHDVEKQARGEVVKPKEGVPDWTDFKELVQ